MLDFYWNIVDILDYVSGQKPLIAYDRPGSSNEVETRNHGLGVLTRVGEMWMLDGGRSYCTLWD